MTQITHKPPQKSHDALPTCQWALGEKSGTVKSEQAGTDFRWRDCVVRTPRQDEHLQRRLAQREKSADAKLLASETRLAKRARWERYAEVSRDLRQEFAQTKHDLRKDYVANCKAAKENPEWNAKERAQELHALTATYRHNLREATQTYAYARRVIAKDPYAFDTKY